MYGVEPSASPLISKGIAGAHKIQGVGANFIPKTFDKNACDEIITVSDEDAYEYARILAREEGILCGISSGASLCAAIEVAKKEESKAMELVERLYDYFLRYPKKMPKLYTEMAQSEPLERCVCDYIAGMTDRYALNVFKEIFFPKMWK